MRKIWLFLFFMPFGLIAQPYGNEWIDFNKSYFKIKVAEDAVYRLGYNDLVAAGFPVTTTDPRRIQLYHRGTEIAIHIEGQNDAVFDPADYIEFYGQKNDGTLDQELYQPPGAQPHTFYNLYADTAAYFLTYYLIPANGKRMVTSTPFTGVPQDNYHNAQGLNVYTDEYSKGVTVSNYTSLTQFDVGEGFTGTRIKEEADPIRDFTLTGLELANTSGPDPTIEIQLVGRNSLIHDIEIFVGPSAGALNSIGTYQFSGYENYVIKQVIGWTNISSSGELYMRVSVIDNGGDNSNISVSYLKLDYAENLDMSGVTRKKFNPIIKASGGDEVQILNTPTNSIVLDITDPNNVLRVVNTDVDPNKVKCGFADATSYRQLFISENIDKTPVIVPVSFRSINPVTAEFVIISHETLMQPVGVVADAVAAYAGYRASASGGGFDTLVVEIGQLYNQFSYGEITPLAIYRFMEFLVDQGDPKFLFLIGKGLEVQHKYHRRNPAEFTYHDLVPTAGAPGSDIPFTAGLAGTTFEQAVPTGRLSVSSPQEIINYLNKVIEMAELPYDALWRKDLLHLSGGKTAFEQNLFKIYVDGFKAIAEDVYLGGEVATVSKATTSSSEYINVSTEVNNGLNLITFFGHSAPNVTDIDIGFVSDPVNGYDNKGKYPMILMNGCNAGNIYNDNYIFGEDWIATANKGATVVIAHTSFGFPSQLRLYSSLFYTVAYADTTFLLSSIGEVQKETGRLMAALASGSPGYTFITQIQQMGLQGDPAVSLFGTRLPDYEINADNIELVGLTNLGITAEADSFAIKIGARNFGTYYLDSLEVAVTRTLQNNTIIYYDTITYSPVRYLDTLSFIIDNDIPDNSGFNRFDITLDPAGKLAEMDVLNNFAGINQNIPLSGTINLFPYDFAVLNKQPEGLTTQSGNLLSSSRSYFFELDSTRQMPSPFNRTATETGIVLAEWVTLPDLTLMDSTGYYWRTKYASLEENEIDQFAESSFSYLAQGSPGWGQLEYFQLDNNKLDGLQRNPVSRTIDFKKTTLSLEVKTYGANHPSLSYLDTELIIDGLPYIFAGSFTICADNRLNVVVFNGENAAPYAAIPGTQVESWTCGRAPQVVNTYPAGKTLDEILDAIKANETVLVFTTGSFDFNSLSPATLTKLENLGANMAVLTTKTPEEPYILLGQQGIGPGNSFAEIIADPAAPEPTDEQEIFFDGNVEGIFASGSMESGLIGPAISWDKMYQKVAIPDPSDSYGIDVIGVNFSGEETALFTNIQVKELPLGSVDENNYPYLKLRLNVTDEVVKTAPQLEHWLVSYLPSPEGILTFISNDSGNKLNLIKQEGETLTSTFGFVNLSEQEFNDSLKVVFTIFNREQRKSLTDSIKIPPPAVLKGDTSLIVIETKTVGLVGTNDLELIVNPFIHPEQNYQNNTLKLRDYLTVVRDDANPLLDVTFDGQYIFDGDIVSPNPEIAIIIRDENPYLLKEDTTGINIFHYQCETCPAQRVSLSGNSVQWTPATGDQPFKILYAPQNLIDGTHKLEVQVEDASGNKSGEDPYRINFEVINKSTITHFYPYPNPFSSSVRFIFTLTGAEIPDEILIRIMTVSGRVVREITQDELGPLRIGNNETDYAWDGRDEFGDQLANGVYLYKVYLKAKGQQIELRQTAGDQAFTNGYGKLYLLR
jgi:hypothetical protein